MILGLLISGLVVSRAGVLPRWTGHILAAGAALSAVGEFGMMPLVGSVGTAVVAIALASIGWLLLSNKVATGN